MPQPAAGDRHVNSLLTNLSLLSMQESKDFVAPQVCPFIKVMKQSDRYVQYTDAFFRRNTMAKRARGTESAGGGWEVDTTPNYHCDTWGLHVDIHDDDRRNSDAVFDDDADATEYLSQQAMVNMEVQFATEIFATSIWTGSTTGSDITPGTTWNASAGKPVQDVRTQGSSIKKKTGQWPNVLVCGYNAWNAIRDNADVLDRIKHTQRGVVTEDIVAQVMGLDRVVVSGAIQTTSAEGAATETTAFINTLDDALLLYVPDVPGKRTPSACYTFVWTGAEAGGRNEVGARMKKFRVEELASDRVEMDQNFDIKQTGATFGVYFDDVVT